MHARFASGALKPSTGTTLRFIRLAILFLPVTLLFIISLRTPPEMSSLLWLGTLFQLLACGLSLWTGRFGREQAGPAVIMLYVIALSWLLLGLPEGEDWFLHLAQAILLVIPLLFFAVQCLRDSGATDLRRARQLAARLASRRDWPRDPMEIRQLPEVKALREALHVDASPALELMANPRTPVRIAALSSLEFRPSWRSGQPQVILQLARRAPEPEVRASAVLALGNIDDRILIESLAELLRDSSPLVRQTTAEALLWNTEQRWHWIRDAVRQALADPSFESDGPLKLEGSQFTKEAVADLHSWTTEKGVVAMRSAMTLGHHYGQLLASGTSPELVQQLRRDVIDSRTAPMLRLELARLLNQYRELEYDDLRKLLDPSMPAAVRLIAVESMMSMGRAPEAMGALHDLARLPNREIALATAEVVQRQFGVDLGLPRDQPLPPVQSRIAADVARRLQAWAAQFDMVEAAAPSPQEVPAFRLTPTSSSRVDL